MEKFTNNRDEYLNRIKKELLEYKLDENWQEIFTYAEIPFFLSYAFSYNWSINTQNLKYQLIRKEWNVGYDHSRFDKGIYNLDRLAIVKKEIEISEEEVELLNSLELRKMKTVLFEGIVLDGLSCNLKINKVERVLTWNIDKEMNNELAKLINEMRSWKREMEIV